MTDQRRLGFGVVGLGRAGGGMVPHVATHPQSQFVAAADTREDVRNRVADDFDIEVYPTVEQLCENPLVDAIYIATPHQFHKQHTIIAAQHGKHVIVEKPMALRLEDCDAMVAAAKQAGVQLLVGHTHSYDPAIRTMRQLIQGGEFGPLGMINTWNYTTFLYRPRRPEELDTSLGGGIIFNQVPHQVDTVRLLGGGLVRSVRAMTGIWDRTRPTEGSCLAFLEFENGAGASIVYNAYDHFDTDEFHHWIGEQGQARSPDQHGSARKALEAARTPQEELAMLQGLGYGGSRPPRRPGDADAHQPHFGVLIASCERADLRPSEDGILVYADDGKRELPIGAGPGMPGRGDVINELYHAVVDGKPPAHNGRWGAATLEVCLAILQSSRERREISMHRQVQPGDQTD
jgi:phthalate 4,5-cis-dihydrodiol dehydrogenase